MPIELKITAADTYEFDLLMRRFLPEAVVSAVETPELPGDPIAPAPKKRVGKGQTAADTVAETGSPTKTEAEKTETAAPADTPASSEPDEHPMLVSKTLADVKALGNKKVSELGAGPIQQLLVESFGVRNFGSLDAADLDRAYAALGALK